MKIKEVLAEGVLGGLAGAVKGIAKGVKEIPGQAVAGYKAAATPDITPADDYQAGAVQPKTSGAQYVSDIGDAIRAGASGDIGYRQSTDVKVEPAPVGTVIGQWKKTENGWVNSNNNIAANPTQSATLDKEWAKFSQKDAKAKAQAQANAQQQSTQSSQANQQQANWQSTQPAATMADNGDIFAGDTQQPTLKLLQTVITPTGQKAFKKSDNKWYRESGTLITTPSDVKQLNQMVTNAKETAKAKGTNVPKVITAQSINPQQPTNPQNDNPAVFKSNRRAK